MYRIAGVVCKARRCCAGTTAEVRVGVRDDWIRNLSNLVVFFILGDVLPTIDGLVDGCDGLTFKVFNQVAGMVVDRDCVIRRQVVDVEPP